MFSETEKALRKKEAKRRYYERNKQLVIARAKKWAKENKWVAEKTPEHLAKRRLARKKWKENNKEAYRLSELKRLAKRNRARRRTDPNFIVKEACRSRLNRSLAGRKSLCTEKMLGCSWSEFSAHIERRFLPGMSWGNRGVRGWHIDHIKPICEFDLTDPIQVSTCFHHTNLQPLWWYDNLAKRFQTPVKQAQ